MRFWWVNQNQTYRREIQGGYLWQMEPVGRLIVLINVEVIQHQK